MAPISSAGSYAIPASQPSRNQVQPEKVTEKAADDQSRKYSEQIATKTLDTTEQATQAAKKESTAEEQQKIEAAQQEAQRAEFDQQAGNVRETEPNAVRPPSNSREESSISAEPLASAKSITNNSISVEPLRAENPAIDIFVQLQNIDNPSRQGQEVNRFA